MSQNRKSIIGVYPGSFDPPTLGHLDIACRAARLVDELVVAVFAHPSKTLMFTTEERVELWKQSLQSLQAPSTISVTSYDGLTTTFARTVQATTLIRGVRTVNDFELEFQQSLMYRRLAPEIEIQLLVTDPIHLFISSSMVKEVARLGAEFDAFVAPPVAAAMRMKLQALQV